MKKFTHAWIAFKAIERLKNAALNDTNRNYADFLINWFENHKDGVIRGAWYPDTVIVDNSCSHIMKYKPDTNAPVREFGKLPRPSLLYQHFKDDPRQDMGFSIDPKYNLPERCEAFSHSIIDNFKIQNREEKGSALSPTDHHIALLIFMLSHYIADAHMPLHCDDRPGTLNKFNLHAAIEKKWDVEVVKYYAIDRPNQRFLYDPAGFPLLVSDATYPQSILKSVDDELAQRHFQVGYGAGNDNVLEYMHSISRYTYLLSYAYLPEGFTLNQLDHNTLQVPQGMPFREMSLISLADAVDAVARIWLHDVRRFIRWEREN
ncbi:MAG: hypothetical protein JEZ00_13155 [Anaerolineaceae bacterium]|nr:hypothetical protein [Anaerolineaceae bacterium]